MPKSLSYGIDDFHQFIAEDLHMAICKQSSNKVADDLYTDTEELVDQVYNFNDIIIVGVRIDYEKSSKITTSNS